MTDRRRTPRYVLANPLRCDAMPMQDVTIVHYSSEQLVVISPSSHPIDETLMVYVTTADGLQNCTGHVLSSTPVTVGDALCFRIALRVGVKPRESPSPATDERVL